MDPKNDPLAWLDSVSAADALSEDQWLRLDFRHLPQVRQTFAALRGHGLTPASEKTVLRALAGSCDPDAALFTLHRWLEAGGAASNNQRQWYEPEFLQTLCMLLAATPALSDHFLRAPERTWPVIEPVLKGQVARGVEWWQSLSQDIRSASAIGGTGVPAGQRRLSNLRRARVEYMLQIAALDLAGAAPLHQTIRTLSNLADFCIEAALEIAVEALRPRLGSLVVVAQPPPAGNHTGEAPVPQQPVQTQRLPFVVFALGKLGGRELNYSSDIDLVFIHAGQGDTSGGSRSVDANSYFTAVAEELVAALDKVGEGGRVYRVDLRLRPHGSAGPLVKSFDEALNYFQTEGRTWERQAWLKARPVAGDLALGDEFLKRLTPFVFRRYLSLEAIGDIQALKRQIELSVARRGESADEVKLGKGGIRDIEFTVQFLQLLHGSEFPKVRGGSTLNALFELHREGLLSNEKREPLEQAYNFLRNVEHRLQLHGDLQVHRLPDDPVVRRRIARSLGYADQPHVTAQEAFEADRARHTTVTREVFERLFAKLFQENTGIDGQLSELLLAPEPDMEKIAALLPAFGFADSESSAKELMELSRENLILTAPSRTRKFFASIAPPMLKALAATGEPEDALRRFSRITGSLGAKAVFYEMLNENRWLLKMTAELAAGSVYLTDILVANPGLFDELVDALQTGQSKSAKEMQGELAQIAAGGDIADTLRAYRAGELLRIGVRDLIHSASLEQTQNELTDLAEAILRVQLDHVLKAHRQRRGEVLGADGAPVQFTVLGLGKFGGREMNYGSDLDVLFFYSGDGQTAAGLPAVNYFIELAQDLTRAMATPTALGSLYELDARLRPNGSKGPLAMSLEYFRRYCADKQLADWERLALTRMRACAGDEALAERAMHMIRSALYSPLNDPQALAREAAAMRQRLEASAEKNDLKRGRGGAMDIEFIAQYLQLIHGPAYPPLRQANTEQALRALVKFKMLTAEDGERLLQGYEFFRRMENRVRIVHGLSSHSLPPKSAALRKLALRAGYADAPDGPAEKSLLDEFARHTEQVREVFERILRTK